MNYILFDSDVRNTHIESKIVVQCKKERSKKKKKEKGMKMVKERV